MKKIIVLLAVLFLSAPARAIELSLEENRAERGSVGYVDMQRLFTSSPDAQRAKEGFQELVRQAEERVNLKKAELLKLHQELDSARLERDALSSSTAAAIAPPASDTAAAVAAPAAPAAAPTSLVPGLTASTATAVAPVAAPAPAQRPNIALPGMASDTAPIAPPPSSTAPAPAPAAAPAVASTAPAVSPAAAANMFPAPPPAPPVVAAPAGPTPTQRLLELDGKIIHLQSEIQSKESELTREHDEADHGLLDVESRKTDQVLARLYRALTAVAHQEGVSVVIDKSRILYGHPAVDLTDKVLKYLQENQQP